MSKKITKKATPTKRINALKSAVPLTKKIDGKTYHRLKSFESMKDVNKFINGYKQNVNKAIVTLPKPMSHGGINVKHILYIRSN